MRHWRVLICPFILLGAMTCSQAEGNYDPFNSKNPEERAQAARMREAIEKDDWKGAEKFATTPALRRLYEQARIELAKSSTPPVKK